MRAILEVNNNNTFSIRVSDLAKLREKLGEEVFDCFYRCFIQADRLTSLVSFAFLSLKEYPIGSIAYRRDGLTAIWFMTGTMKEIGSDLEELRSALVKARLWNRESWKQKLQKWEHWAITHNISAIRNQIAFHVDRDRISSGILKSAQKNVFIYKSETLKNNDGWFESATEALLQGIQADVDSKNLQVDLEYVIKNVGEFLAVGHSLAGEFMRVLGAARVTTVKVITKGGKATSSFKDKKGLAKPKSKSTKRQG